MNLILEPNKEIPLRWDGNHYYINNAAIVDDIPQIEITPFDAELAEKLKNHLVANKDLKLEVRDGFCELPVVSI